MLGAGLHDIHAIHGSALTRDRARLCGWNRAALTSAVAALAALVVWWGASFHGDRTGPGTLPERMRSTDPVYLPLVITLTTVVAMSEFTLMVAVYFALHNRTDEFTLGLFMTAVRILCVTCLEYFIVHNTGDNALSYYSRVVGAAAATHLHNAVLGWKAYALAKKSQKKKKNKTKCKRKAAMAKQKEEEKEKKNRKIKTTKDRDAIDDDDDDVEEEEEGRYQAGACGHRDPDAVAVAVTTAVAGGVDKRRPSVWSD